LRTTFFDAFTAIFPDPVIAMSLPLTVMFFPRIAIVPSFFIVIDAPPARSTTSSPATSVNFFATPTVRDCPICSIIAPATVVLCAPPTVI
jgi:hypothetical protein